MTEVFVQDFIKGLLIFLRIAAVMFTAPVFGNKSIPRMAILLLSLVFTYMIFFITDTYHFNLDEGLLELAIVAVKETITGMIIGYSVNFIFQALSYAGMLIGFDMGISMSQAFDINSDSYTNNIGQLFITSALIIFLLINGHHYVIRALAFSFKVVPIGFYSINEEVYKILLRYSGSVFVLAVKIAAPIMISFFLIHISAGIVARVSPQMNVFFVIHPLKIGLGFLLLFFFIPTFIYFMASLLKGFEHKLFYLVKAMNG